MPYATIPSLKVARAAISKNEAHALKAPSDLKHVSLIEDSFLDTNPDYLEVPSNAVHGLALEFVQCISLDSAASLRLRLQRPDFCEQPTDVTGITILGVAGGSAGDGTLTFVAAGTLLSWQAPGAGAAGATVNVGTTGIFELDGGGGLGQTLRVRSVGGSLPGTDESDTLTVAEIDDIIPVTLVPVNTDIFFQWTTPLLTDKNVRVVFEMLGLSATDEYSIFASVFRWRPTEGWRLTQVGG